MARSMSATAKAAMFAPETVQTFLALIEISHAELGAPIRLVNNTANVVSGGNTYTAFPFRVELPKDDAESIAHVRLTLCNVDQSLIPSFREIGTPLNVDLNIVLASDPDTVEAGPFNFTMQNMQYDAGFIVADLAFEDILNEPYPPDTMTPAKFPGLFN